MNLSKLNHIFIPKTLEEQERFRQSRLGKLSRRLFLLFLTFSREGQILLFIWLLGSVMSLNIGFTQYYVIWSALTGVLIASVVLRRSVRLNDVELHIQGPQRVTRGEDVQFTIVVQNKSQEVHQGIRIERPFLPWDGKYLTRRPVLPYIEPDSVEHRSFRARFAARGEHSLGSVSARALAPLGLALGPFIESEDIRFLVIPKIANVTHLHIEQSQKYQPGGVALASITGEAQELIGVRPYRPGDSIRDLHAKTWARTGYPAVREYQQEYFTRIGIIVDTDGGEPDEPLLEELLSLSAGIVAQLSRGEILLDVLVVGDVIHELTLGRSLGFLDQALDVLACVEPQHGLDTTQLRARLSSYLERLSSVIFLSLRWDEERERFTHWIEQQGVRCKKVHVYDKEPEALAVQGGAIVLQVSDIEQGKELIL